MPNADPREIIRQALEANQGMVDRTKALNDDLLQDRASRKPLYGHVDNNDTVSDNDLGSGDDSYALGENGLEATFGNALNRMIAESGGRISISSGRRSTERQAQLWEDALNKYGDPEIADNYVARPGTSHHEVGTAADLRFADDAAREWAHQNAARYGIYFPMAHEPWHAEPVKRPK